MPSPFPGMDPYLERPSRWSGFHKSFVVSLSFALNSALPETYVAEVDERSTPEPDGSQWFINVRRDGDMQVTTIEVLCPDNKSDGKGRRDYTRRRQTLLERDSHFIEIDLLRSGQPLHAPDCPPADYYVLVSNLQKRPKADLYPFSVREPLPAIAVPLHVGAVEPVLALGDAFTEVYDRSKLAQRIDYGAETSVPLRPDDATWADALLREKGLR